MSEPASIAVDLNEVLETLERMYMTQRERGFAHPKPKLIDAGDDRAADIPPAFLEWWRKHENCDLNPVVAWKAATYRNEFYDKNIRSGSV